MNELRFRYERAETVRVPLPIPVHDTPFARDAGALPSIVLTEAGGSRTGPCTRSLTVDLRPAGPFGPDSRVLLRFFFDEDRDFREALITVRRRLGGPPVRVLGLPPENRFREPGVFFRRRAAPASPSARALTLPDLKKLHGALTAGAYEEGTLLNVFLGPGRVLALFVPSRAPLKSVLAEVPELREALERSPQASLVHPLSGAVLDPERHTAVDAACRGSAHLFLTGSGWRLTAAGGVLFPFPYFDRRVSVRHGTPARRRPSPCLNCLACARYCPAGLYPAYLYHNRVHGSSGVTGRHDPAACGACGTCSFVCPVGLPLHDTIRRQESQSVQGVP